MLAIMNKIRYILFVSKHFVLYLSQTILCRPHGRFNGQYPAIIRYRTNRRFYSVYLGVSERQRMDRRQKKTREAIFRAFTELLKDEPYSKITIQQIIDAADVGRTTFYAHFETKDDLLKEMCQEIFDHVFSHGLIRETTHDFSHSGSLEAVLTHILYHLRDDRSYLKGLLSDQNDSIFMKYLKDDLRLLLEKNLQISDPEVPQEYVLDHMVSDFAETISWWMKNDRYTPEQICSFYLKTTPYLEH